MIALLKILRIQINKYKNNRYTNIIDEQNYNKRELLELHSQRNYILKEIRNKKEVTYNESIELSGFIKRTILSKLFILF